jgi:hypothetical protein
MALASVLAAGFGCLISLYGIFASKRRMSRIGFYYSTLGFGVLAYAMAMSEKGFLTVAVVMLLGGLLTWLPELLRRRES